MPEWTPEDERMVTIDFVRGHALPLLWVINFMVLWGTLHLCVRSAKIEEDYLLSMALLAVSLMLAESMGWERVSSIDQWVMNRRLKRRLYLVGIVLFLIGAVVSALTFPRWRETQGL